MDQVTLYNLALSAINTRSAVSSINENSTEANNCNLHYLPALEAVLQGARWNFARRQVVMTLLQDATLGQTVPTPWMYEYSIPSDCVAPRYIIPTVQLNFPADIPGIPSAPSSFGPPVRFLVSSDLDANGNPIPVILTNQQAATLVYTSRITNPNMWDGTFVEALRYYLGARICMALTGDKAMAKESFEYAQELVKKAQAINGNEGLTIIDNTPDWMKVRGYASDWGCPDGGYWSYGPANLQMVS